MLEELASEFDAIAHKSPAAKEFSRIAQRDGLKAALAWQNRLAKPLGGTPRISATRARTWRESVGKAVFEPGTHRSSRLSCDGHPLRHASEG